MQAERAGFVARLLVRHGVSVVVATISPYRDARARERAHAEAEGVPFLEVFLDASPYTLRRRDVKGLYRRARVDRALALSGVSAPYEPPVAADIHLHTDAESIESSRDRILATLSERGLWR